MIILICLISSTRYFIFSIYFTDEVEALSNITFTQPMLLASACGTPEYTNFTVGFADCLDYIFYDTESFVVEQVSFSILFSH